MVLKAITAGSSKQLTPTHVLTGALYQQTLHTRFEFHGDDASWFCESGVAYFTLALFLTIIMLMNMFVHL